MGRFLVERYVPDLSELELQHLVRRVARAAPDMAAVHGVVHVRSVLVPGDELCVCEYEAADGSLVRVANEETGLPFDRVVAATAFGPTELQQGETEA